MAPHFATSVIQPPPARNGLFLTRPGGLVERLRLPGTDRAAPPVSAMVIECKKRAYLKSQAMLISGPDQRSMLDRDNIVSQKNVQDAVPEKEWSCERFILLWCG
jgi:hypothetical protein